MHLRAKPPVLVPTEYRDELEQSSKATLMDIVWSMATRLAGSEEDELAIMETFREEWLAVTNVRAQR